MEKELGAKLKQPRVRSPMSISKLRDHIDESESVESELTGDEILKEIDGRRGRIR